MRTQAPVTPSVITLCALPGLAHRDTSPSPNYGNDLLPWILLCNAMPCFALPCLAVCKGQVPAVNKSVRHNCKLALCSAILLDERLFVAKIAVKQARERADASHETNPAPQAAGSSS